MVTDTSIPRRIADVIVSKMHAAERTVLGLSDRTGIPRTTLKRRLRTGASLEVAELAAIADALDTTMIAIIKEATATPASPQEVLDHEVACGECGSLDEAAAHLASLAGPGEDAPAGGDAPTAPMGDAAPALAGSSVREAA